MTPEERLQVTIADYLTLTLPKDIEWCHVPNGGSRNKAEAAKLKRMGVRAGWPDLQFVRHGKIYVMELKRPDKPINADKSNRRSYLTPAQRAVKDRLLRAGVPYAVCRSLEEVEGTLDAWGLTKAAA